MLEVVGRLMEQCSWIVRAIVMDGHSSNSWVRSALFGDFRSIPTTVLEQVTFFKQIEYKDLPENAMPYLNIKLAFHEEEPLWMLQGVCPLVECVSLGFGIGLGTQKLQGISDTVVLNLYYNHYRLNQDVFLEFGFPTSDQRSIF